MKEKPLCPKSPKLGPAKRKKSAIRKNKLPQNFVPNGMLGYENISSHNSCFILGLRIIIGIPKRSLTRSLCNITKA